MGTGLSEWCGTALGGRGPCVPAWLRPAGAAAARIAPGACGAAPRPHPAPAASHGGTPAGPGHESPCLRLCHKATQHLQSHSHLQITYKSPKDKQLFSTGLLLSFQFLLNVQLNSWSICLNEHSFLKKCLCCCFKAVWLHMVKNIKWKGIRNKKGRLTAWKAENFGLSILLQLTIKLTSCYLLKFYWLPEWNLPLKNLNIFKCCPL